MSEPESAASPRPVPDKVAMVTGASRGIGAAIAPALAQDGYAVCLLARDGAAAAGERADLSAYTASKAALARITGSTHRAWWSAGIRAFDLAPGIVRTEMTLSMDLHRGRTRWTEPADVTNLVVALASGELDDWSGRFVRAGSTPRPRCAGGPGSGWTMMRAPCACGRGDHPTR